MAIDYPKDRQFSSALKCALSHPTFEDGLNWLITWEHENAMHRWINTNNRETCFAFCVRKYFEARPVTLMGHLGAEDAVEPLRSPDELPREKQPKDLNHD